ncbi:fungal trichothecene efflux pump [Colletotrichum karsti]|uniref:Fungal trichothecene efflux pump n=1 Tax=Colletotrichum karsti TaxID=1095194 RepID=A0A9P6HY26_9PEZI|nr:fungal trichothecene efflux pump [Colletotrichum karsti]KAF9872529.1 fungal trichothecene efflux pump [Colletotrichum karsti]
MESPVMKKPHDEENVHVTEHGLSSSSMDSDSVVHFEIDQDALPKGYFRSKFFVGSMLGISLGLMAGTAGFAFAAPILTLINADIGPDPNIVWVALVYTLTSAVCITVIGRVTDIFGRRPVFIGGAALGVIGSIVAATATNVNALIAGSTIIGVAASTQLSFYYVIGELVPMQYRLASCAVCYVFCIPASGFAPLISQAFVQYHPATGWRGGYYILTGINAASLLCWVLFYHPPTFRMKHGAEASMWSYVKRFDYVGAVLYTGGILVLMMGLNWGGVVYAWSSPAVIATVVVGVAAVAAFAVWESFADLSEPFVPMRYFRNLGWVACAVLSGLAAGVYYCFALVWPQMVGLLYSDPENPFFGPLLSCFVALFFLVGDVVGGFAGKYIGHLKWQCVITTLLGGVCFAAMATCGPDTVTRAAVLVSFGVFFNGWVEGCSITVTTLAAPDQGNLGGASGMAGSIRFLISAIAASIYSAILSNRLAETIPAMVPAAVVAEGLPESSVPDFVAGFTSGTFEGVAGLTDTILAVGTRAYKEANSDAFRTIFYANIGFSVVALICALCLPDVDKFLTSKVATTLHQGRDEKKIAGEKDT